MSDKQLLEQESKLLHNHSIKKIMRKECEENQNFLWEIEHFEWINTWKSQDVRISWIST